MTPNSIPAKLLRILGIILMGLTAVFTLMSGAGTTCVALAAERFGPNMAPIAPYKWLYILFVLVTLAIGVMGVRAVVLLVKGRPNAYRYTWITLVAGTVVGGVHMLVSRALRGKSMPVDAVVYTTLITLAVFLLFRLPGLRHMTDTSKTGNASGMGGGLAAIMAGAAVLTVQYWAGPTHTWGGVNYADVWHNAFLVTGWGLALAGGLLIALWSAGRRLPAWTGWQAQKRAPGSAG
jgi:hypothetical protein